MRPFGILMTALTRPRGLVAKAVPLTLQRAFDRSLADCGHFGCYAAPTWRSTFCSGDRTAEWPQPARQRPPGGPAIGRSAWGKKTLLFFLKFVGFAGFSCVLYGIVRCCLRFGKAGWLLVLCKNEARTRGVGWFWLMWRGYFTEALSTARPLDGRPVFRSWWALANSEWRGRVCD